jgi:hypothetical protein
VDDVQTDWHVIVRLRKIAEARDRYLREESKARANRGFK